MPQGASPLEMLEAGIGHIPEDRHRYGLVLDFTLAENAALHDFRHPPDSRFGWLRPKALAERTRRLIEEFDVRGGSPQTKARSLSGGNQQKLVAAREVDRDPRVLIAGAADEGPRRRRHRVPAPPARRRSATPGARSSSCRSSSTRCSRSPIASSSCTRAPIVAEHASGVTEEEIGVEMLGGQREAVA